MPPTDSSNVAVVAAVIVSVMGMVTAVLGPFLLAWLTDRKLRDIQRTGELTHAAVNGSMTTQLRVAALALGRVAELTKNADDVAAAELALKALQDHEAQVKKNLLEQRK